MKNNNNRRRAVGVNPSIDSVLAITTAILDQNILAGNNFSLDLGQGHFADGDTLAYNLTKSDGSAAPSWVNFNPVTMTLSGVIC